MSAVDQSIEDDLEALAEAAALRSSGGEWRRLIETLPQIVWITRPDGWHLHYNQKWMDFTGLTLEESLGFGWNPPFHPEDREEAARRWARATSTGEPYEVEYRLRRADGVYRWMLGRAMPLRDDSGRIVRWFGTCTDIEDLKRTQAELEESRSALKESSRQNAMLAERLTTTLESITDAFFTVDRDWRMTYVNRRAEELLRRSRTDLLDQRLWEAFPEAVGSILDEVYHRAMRTGVSEVIEEFHWAPVDIWVTIHAYPSEQGLAVYFQDITGRRQAAEELLVLNAELNDANVQLAEAARLKDDLLSMASHELRTPLTPILGFLEIFEQRGSNLTEDQRRLVKVMGSNATRMLRLVDDLLVVSRASAGVLVAHPRRVSARELIEPVLEELADTVSGVELAVDGCELFVDPQHLQQVVMNLLTNAKKYGAPPVAVTAVPAGEGRVVLEVADHGQGISEDFRARMWERFVQKDRGDARTATGVGLGLAIVKLLTETNQGTVGYRDGIPSGAVFTVELPGRLEGPAGGSA